MKAYKTITILTIIILVVILSIISFAGLYVLKDYKARDVIKNYQFGKEYSKSRVVELTVGNTEGSTTILDKDGNEVTEKEDGVEYTEENGYTIIENTPTNSAESLTKDNYIKSKKIIAKRLKQLKVEEFDVKLNEENGTISIDMTENDKTDELIPIITSEGRFELQDSETKEVLMDNSHIKSVKTIISQIDNSLVVYLQIKFNKDGAKKLEEISKVYVETKPAETTEDGEEIPAESKDVTLLINGEELKTTHFGDTLPNGVLNVPIGSGASRESIIQAEEFTNEYAVLLNSGLMPIKYEQTNYEKINSMNLFNNKIVLYSALAVAVIAFLFLIIKLKLKGLLAIILEVGYIATLLLAIRYTNVKVTLLGIIGICVSVFINYYYLYKAFKNIELDFIKDTTKKIAFIFIPLYVLAIVFTFSSVGRIASLGMSLVWGIIIMYLYNLSLTQIAVRTLKDK